MAHHLRVVQCAWAAIRTKDTYLRAKFHRLKSRVGPMKAIIAIAASMLTFAFHMLTTGSEYMDLGPAHLDRRDHTKLAKTLVRRLENLGLRSPSRRPFGQSGQALEFLVSEGNRSLVGMLST